MAVAAAFVLSLAAARTAPSAPLDRASWIWSHQSVERCHLRNVFTLDATPTNATVLITADNGYELYVNGSFVGSEVGAAADVWQSVERYDLTSRLAKGRNVIGIQGINLGGVRGVIAAIRVQLKTRPSLELVTDGTWRVMRDGQAVDYSHPEYVEGPEWRNARVVGSMGMAPWGQLAWSEADERSRTKTLRTRVDLADPGGDFTWPTDVAFLGDDCSVYVPLRGDAWGVAFRVGDWSRAYTEFDLPCPSKIGRKLYTLKPGPAMTPRLLLDAGLGAIGSPTVAFDGNSLMVAMARDGEKFFHIYRISTVGDEPQRLTDGPFHDIDPVELPDGRIIFASTRIGTFEEYHQPPSRALFRMNADGSDIHLITSTPIFDNEPKVMANGRVAFIRTDNFFDRGKVETQLHSIRPDGTDGLTEFGADVGPEYGTRLRAFGYGSPAPLPDGRFAYISNRGNFIGASGSAEREQHPLPADLGDLAALPDGRLLCTVLRQDGKRMTSDVLGVIDPRQHRVVSIFESTAGAIHSPVFLGSRIRPPVIPDYADRARPDRPAATGFLFCMDARFTTKTKAAWERIRAIRVLGAVPMTTRSSHSHIVHVGHETVELGTVPLARDGSFNVEVPADMPLALQAVDAEGRSELNEMSWLYVRPGERRSCIGCHQPRQATPTFAGHSAEALRAPPVKLLGQGDPHRFRGNNPGVTGMMDLQFERFRECASLNRNILRDLPNASRREEITVLVKHLNGADEGLRISAAQRLALLRERGAAPALAVALNGSGRETRIAAALALAACGTRESVQPLLIALDDKDPVVAQAANLALENLTAHAVNIRTSRSWNQWLMANPWSTIEAGLVQDLSVSSPANRSTIVALGHIGSDEARAALRGFVRTEAVRHPYPPFVEDNRTDNFTFASASPLNPRTLQEAVRALGQLRDTHALPLLSELLARNIDPVTGNLYLVEAILESLGRIGSHEAESTLIETFALLKDYWHYVGWYSDHPALYACHSSPIHARIIEALDALGSTRTATIVPRLIRSVPTDPDRGLFLQNDDYETLVGRLIRRSGRGNDVVETCLDMLGDPSAVSTKDLKAAIATTHPAWGGHPGPENRASQILSLTCRDTAEEPRIRAAFERFRSLPEEPISRTLGNPTWTPIRHWTLFYLARSLGNLHDSASVDTLAAVLTDELNEARHGRPDPSQPEIHLLHLDYTPCWRAAAAWALGEIRDRRAWPALIGAVRNLDNATDVRHAAAKALGKITVPSDLAGLSKLAADCPEVSVRKVLEMACSNLSGTVNKDGTMALRQQSK